MNIRPATPADIPSILSVERTSDRAAHWSETEYRNAFLAGTVPRIILVAEETEILAFIFVRALGPEWEIENVAVSADARRHGIGVKLIQAVATQAQHRGAEALILEVRASNQAARGLYERAGFNEAGRRKDYYANPTEDAIHYRLDLRPNSPQAP